MRRWRVEIAISQLEIQEMVLKKKIEELMGNVFPMEEEVGVLRDEVRVLEEERRELEQMRIGKLGIYGKMMVGLWKWSIKGRFIEEGGR